MSARRPARRARFDYDLERLIHEKARLGILTALAAERGGVAFNDLKALCDLTDGNLSRHLDKLIEAELVAVEREADEGRPCSVYRLTGAGRARFLEYLSELERVVADAAPARAAASRRPGRPRAHEAGS